MNYTMLAPAKINLGLEILKKLKNGYHEISTVMQAVSLHDIIKIKVTQGDKILINCDKVIDYKANKNTAYIAAKYFFKYSKIKPVGLEIKIQKRIPVCAGLAGGSTDAAAVLLILNDIFETNLTKNKLLKIAKKIGSDVPFCLFKGTQHLLGTGINLKVLKNIPKCYIVIVKPKIQILTKESYRRIKSEHFKNTRTNLLLNAINSGDLKNICKNFFNTFEDILPQDLYCNEIFKIKEILIKHLALGAQMTGSGSAVFGIFEDKNLAKACFVDIRKVYKESFLCIPVNY